MAEEVSPQLVEHGEKDHEKSRNSAPGPSIAEVAMRHVATQATLDLDAAGADSRVDSTNDPTEQIVVDLRSLTNEDGAEATVELHMVREVPAVLDFDTLETITLPNSDGDTALFDIDQLDSAPVSAPEASAGMVEAAPLSAMPLSGLAIASGSELAAKRVMDISIALLAFLILLPFLILIAALVKTTSRGPVLYRSRRIGKGGKEFTFLKFRSMYDGAADDLAYLAAHNEQSGPVFKMKEDPRITPLGRCLRKASIDELPQLVHVLSGKMSLVGPRPALPDEAVQYDIRARQRLTVKPGITCTWQVSGRSELDFDTWIDMDVEYIRDWTLFTDLRLLALTVPAVLGGRGAY